MIVLFTDFGLAGPYTGQMKAVLAAGAPGVPVIDLFADAPAFDPMLSAYLLAAHAGVFPAGTVFLGVVDPGVGTDRRPVVVEAAGRRFVGPDNGLFALVMRRARAVRAWAVDWRPERLSASFHGRDLFAPVAALLARGEEPGVGFPATPLDSAPLGPASLGLASLGRPEWPDDLPRIVYVDVYGNAMTGMRAATLPDSAVLSVGGRAVRRAHTFGSVPRGEALWYENSNGLAEIAVNSGRADRDLGLTVGMPVTVLAGEG